MYSSAYSLISVKLWGGVGWSKPRPDHFIPLERDQVCIVQGAGLVRGLVWTVVEKLSSAGIRSPDRPARSELLYRLSYPGSQSYCNDYKYLKYRFGNAIYSK
jgi:hypothetical protein